MQAKLYNYLDNEYLMDIDILKYNSIIESYFKINNSNKFKIIFTLEVYVSPIIKLDIGIYPDIHLSSLKHYLSIINKISKIIYAFNDYFYVNYKLINKLNLKRRLNSSIHLGNNDIDNWVDFIKKYHCFNCDIDSNLFNYIPNKKWSPK